MSASSPTNTVCSPFSSGPFPHPDIFKGSGGRYLPLGDMVNCAKVNKCWHAFMLSPELSPFWLAMFDSEKFPRVKGRENHAMADFLAMLPVCYSARCMACIGKFVGDVPKISTEEFFRVIRGKGIPHRRDAFLGYLMAALTGKESRYGNSMILVEPLAIKIPYDENVLNDLVVNGDFDTTHLDIDDIKKNGVVVPYSLKKFKILCKYPIINKTDGPIFEYFDPLILEKCNAVAKNVQVTILNDQPVSVSVFDNAREYLAKFGYELTPLQTVLYFLSTKMLREGQFVCSTNTSDTILQGNKVWTPCVKSQKSIEVYGNSDVNRPYQMATRRADVIDAKTDPGA